MGGGGLTGLLDCLLSTAGGCQTQLWDRLSLKRPRLNFPTGKKAAATTP